MRVLVSFPYRDAPWPGCLLGYALQPLSATPTYHHAVHARVLHVGRSVVIRVIATAASGAAARIADCRGAACRDQRLGTRSSSLETIRTSPLATVHFTNSIR